MSFQPKKMAGEACIKKMKLGHPDNGSLGIVTQVRAGVMVTDLKSVTRYGSEAHQLDIEDHGGVRRDRAAS